MVLHRSPESPGRWWLWISTTGNFALGTGCWGTTKVDRGVYSSTVSDRSSARAPPRRFVCAVSDTATPMSVITQTTMIPRRIMMCFPLAGSR